MFKGRRHSSYLSRWRLPTLGELTPPAHHSRTIPNNLITFIGTKIELGDLLKEAKRRGAVVVIDERFQDAWAVGHRV